MIVKKPTETISCSRLLGHEGITHNRKTVDEVFFSRNDEFKVGLLLSFQVCSCLSFRVCLARSRPDHVWFAAKGGVLDPKMCFALLLNPKAEIDFCETAEQNLRRTSSLKT